MRWVRRDIERQVREASKAFPVVVLTGPRRSGLSALLRHLFPGADYQLLEAPDVVARARADPRSWLASLRRPVILDEIQNAPELLPWVRAEVDARPRRQGAWLVTGSQDFSLMAGVTESMSGRAAVLSLLPLSVSELGRLDVVKGGYPEVWARPASRALWFESYLQTFLERDVRSLRAVHDLSLFRRFLGLLAARHGQVLNRTDVATALGMSVPTVTSWLSILETTGQVVLVPPYFENFGKRLIKSPRLYWVDSGMACHLLGLADEAQVDASPFLGAVFEGAVAAEAWKAQANAGRRRELYFFRDERGHEVDFVVPRPGARIALIEVKAARTVVPADAKPMLRLGAPAGTERVVVYRGADEVPLGPGVRALPVDALARWLRR